MLVLAPESEKVMHRDRTKEQPQDCHPVKVENLCRIVENCPLLDMYLPMQKSLEKPVPFWTVTITHEKEKANMELIDVAVSVGVSTGILGELAETSGGIMLQSYINPESTVKVILPLYVNHRTLEFGDQLLFYKKAGKAVEKKGKDLEEIDEVAEFVSALSDARKRKRQLPQALNHHKHKS